MKTLTAEEFDELAESGADISEYLDWDNATRGESKRINLDLPIGFLAALDREAVRRGVTRQSLIKVWLYERLVPVRTWDLDTKGLTEIGGMGEFVEIKGNAQLVSPVTKVERPVPHSRPVKKK
jgi:hypothetical protein